MTHPKAQPLSAREELAALPLVQLIERLRGKYTIPVNDGAGPLNGSMEFTREFETSPIDHEAATRLEMMTATIAARDAEIAFTHETNRSLQACLEGEIKLKAEIAALKQKILDEQTREFDNAEFD